MFNKVLRLLRQLVHRGSLVSVKFSNGVEVIRYRATGGDPFDDVEKIEDYGFASSPRRGAEVIALSLGGNGSHTVAIKVGDRRYRLELSEGDSAIYDWRGNYVWIKEELMHVKHTTKIVQQAPDVEVIGNFKVTGNSNFLGTMVNNGKDVGASHGHTGDSGGSINGVT